MGDERPPDLSRRRRFRALARRLTVPRTAPRYLTDARSSFARRAADESTPPVVARWGFDGAAPRREGRGGRPRRPHRNAGGDRPGGVEVRLRARPDDQCRRLPPPGAGGGTAPRPHRVANLRRLAVCCNL